MKGIYSFTNKSNGKKYIGQSNRIMERMEQHRRNCTNKNLDAYHNAFYRAIRKYGWDSFEIEILHESRELSRDDLNELEIYYINEHESYKKGYNMNKGGNYTSSKKVLSDEDVLEIKRLLGYESMTLVEIANKFNVENSLISMINKGSIWKDVGSRNFPIRSRAKMQLNAGEKNPNATICDSSAMSLREEFVDSTLREIHEDNGELLSWSGMKKLLYGVTFQHLPIYKKREKKWFLNGTCIDYPRLEE